MSDLPESWEWTTLADVCISITDGDHQPPPQTSSGIPFLVIGNIRNFKLDFDECRYVSQDYFNSLKMDRRPQKGDVLYSLVGSYGIPAAVLEGRPFCVQRHIGILRPSERISQAFLTYLLHSHNVYDQATRYATGTAQLTVPLKGLRRIRIPLPPLDEQARIAAVIDEQFSHLDAGVAALKSAQQRQEKLRNRSIFALIAGTGEKHRLEEVADIRLGRQRSPKNHVGPNMLPYLRAANVTWSGLNLSDVKEMNFSAAEVSTYKLRRGDVLVAEASGSATEVGKPAVWDESLPVCCFQNTLLRLRSDVLLPDYLYYVILALARSGAFARASKGVGIHHLSKTGLASTQIEVPAIEAQRELVGTISEQQQSYDRLEVAISNGMRRAKALHSSILSSAFSGKLA